MANYKFTQETVSFPNIFKRTARVPMDVTSVYTTLENLKKELTDSLGGLHDGQIVTVVGDSTASNNGAYVITKESSSTNKGTEYIQLATGASVENIASSLSGFLKYAGELTTLKDISNNKTLVPGTCWRWNGENGTEFDSVDNYVSGNSEVIDKGDLIIFLFYDNTNEVGVFSILQNNIDVEGLKEEIIGSIVIPTPPSAANVTPNDISDSSSVGGSDRYARQDHTHKLVTSTRTSTGTLLGFDSDTLYATETVLVSDANINHEYADCVIHLTKKNEAEREGHIPYSVDEDSSVQTNGYQTYRFASTHKHDSSRVAYSDAETLLRANGAWFAQEFGKSLDYYAKESFTHSTSDKEGVSLPGGGTKIYVVAHIVSGDGGYTINAQYANGGIDSKTIATGGVGILQVTLSASGAEFDVWAANPQSSAKVDYYLTNSETAATTIKSLIESKMIVFGRVPVYRANEQDADSDEYYFMHVLGKEMRMQSVHVSSERIENIAIEMGYFMPKGIEFYSHDNLVKYTYIGGGTFEKEEFVLS